MPYQVTYVTPEVGTGVGQNMGWGQSTKTKTCAGLAAFLSTGSTTELETGPERIGSRNLRGLGPRGRCFIRQNVGPQALDTLLARRLTRGSRGFRGLYVTRLLNLFRWNVVGQPVLKLRPL